MKDEFEIKVHTKRWIFKKVESHDPGLFVDGEARVGATWPNRLEVYISNELTKQIALETVLHELAHCYIYSTQIKNCDELTDEDLCDFCAIYAGELYDNAMNIYTALFV